jgi:hypothetical protein
MLNDYLTMRHFIRHTYGFRLDWSLTVINLRLSRDRNWPKERIRNQRVKKSGRTPNKRAGEARTRQGRIGFGMEGCPPRSCPLTAGVL